MIVTSHQPNWLPGASVLEKVRVADVCIWSDGFQFSRGGYTNRNRFPDESWCTIPVEAGSTGLPINRVRIVEHAKRGWRARMCRELRTAWPWVATERVCEEIMRPYRLLVGLNVSCLRILCDELRIDTEWVFQTHLDAGHAVPVVSDNPAHLVNASERLAMMVEEVGGTTYLSGPSGKNYLSEAPFAERGIEVEYFEWSGSNPCGLELAARISSRL
jgi:hypothetical protein